MCAERGAPLPAPKMPPEARHEQGGRRSLPPPRRPQVSNAIRARPPSFVLYYHGRPLRGLHAWLQDTVWSTGGSHAPRGAAEPSVFGEWAARAAAAGHPRAQSCLYRRGQAIVVDQQLNALVHIATGAREPALAGALWSRDYRLWDGAPPAERARFARQLRARTGLPPLAGRELRRVHPLTATAISFLFARFGLPVAAQVVVHSPSLAVASSIDQVWRCAAGRLWLLELKKAQSAGRAHGEPARVPPLAHALWRAWADTELNRFLVQAALGHALFELTYDLAAEPQPPRSAVVCVGTYGVRVACVPEAMLGAAREFCRTVWAAERAGPPPPR
eukprot:g73299.t1